MTFHSLFRFRRSSGDTASASSGSGIIFLMMSLVFVPIAAVHLVSLWAETPGGVGAQQLASIVGLFFRTF